MVAEVEDWEDLRTAGAAIKDATLADLEQHLVELEANLTAQGAVVHWARDAEEANRIVAEVAKSHGVDEVVKVKSMVTQEIGLNEALAAEGIAAWETDLAELIVQLGDDLPSHILVPAIHRNRAEIRQIFIDRMAAAGRPPPDGLTDDPPELAAAARLHLREKFLRAKMAVSGANFAVAETGTLVVVESEGNGRMCLTLPEVLVSVVGIEKVVPTFADLDVFLRLLPRSSTGERMNPYTSTWSGVTPGDGPQEVHVVLLDNGRTRALADEVGRQALRCIRCSACLNVCPVYERVGGHAYGSVYPGPIGAILNPLMRGVGEDPQVDSLPYASSLCGACYEVCPVKIDIPYRARGPAGTGGRCAPRRYAEAGSRRDEGRSLDVRVLEASRVRRAVRAARHRGGPTASAGLGMDRCPRPADGTGRVVPGLVAAHGRGERPMVEERSASAREEILARVRAATATATATPYVAPARASTDRARSTCSWNASRTTARSWSDAPEADLADRVTAAVEGCSVVVPEGLGVEVSGAVVDHGLSALELDAIDAVVTEAVLGIAETGTIVLDHRAGQGRRAITLVPDRHVCIVRADQVVADVPDAVALLPPGPAAHLDQRTVGHERHRAQPGRRRARPTEPARDRRRLSSYRSGRDVAHSVPELGQDAGEESGHLHLGDADPVRDLALGEAVEETQSEDESVAVAEGAHGGMQHHPGLGGAMVFVVTWEQVSERRCSVVPHGQVQRSRCEAAVAGQRFEDGSRRARRDVRRSVPGAGKPRAGRRARPLPC